MVPEGWNTTKLGEVFKSRREKGSGGLPTFSVTLNDGLVLRESLDRKTETNLSPEEHLLVRKGDIAYNMMRMWQGASGLARFDALVSPAYVVLKPTKEIDSVFASYLFKSARMIYLFWAYSYGLTNDRLRLYSADFSLIPVVLPPIEEQRRIGELLTTWDRAIEILDKLMINSEKRKQALMQKLLSVDYRSPRPRKTAVTAKPLKSVAEFIRDGTHGTHERVTDGIPLLSAASVLDNGLIDFDHAPMVTSSDYQKIHAKYEIQENDVLITVVGTLGRVAVVPKCQKFTVQRSVAIVRPGPELDPRYMAHIARSFAFQHQLKKRANITAQSGVYLGELAKIQIPIVGIEDQKTIARTLDRAEEDCLRQTELQASLRAQKLL